MDCTITLILNIDKILSFIAFQIATLIHSLTILACCSLLVRMTSSQIRRISDDFLSIIKSEINCNGPAIYEHWWKNLARDDDRGLEWLRETEEPRRKAWTAIGTLMNCGPSCSPMKRESSSGSERERPTLWKRFEGSGLRERCVGDEDCEGREREVENILKCRKEKKEFWFLKNLSIVCFLKIKELDPPPHQDQSNSNGIFF